MAPNLIIELILSLIRIPFLFLFSFSLFGPCQPAYVRLRGLY